MEIINIDYNNPSKKDISKIIDYLKKDSVILIPSDTCYGFSCNINSKKAVEKISKLKNRKKNAPYSISCSIDFFKNYIDISHEQEESIYKFLPGRYTLVVPKSNLVPGFVTNSSHLVGIRVMDCPFTNSLLYEYDEPIITTSANISNEPVSYEISSVLNSIDTSLIDLVVDAGILEKNKPSKVIRIFKDGEEDILRD